MRGAQVEVRAGLSLPRDAAECQAISVGEMGQIDTRASGPVELEGPAREYPAAYKRRPRRRAPARGRL